MRIVCDYTTLHLSASFKLDRLYPERDLSSFLPFYTQSSVAGENQASSKKGHGKALLLTLVIGVPNHYHSTLLPNFTVLYATCHTCIFFLQFKDTATDSSY